MSVEIPERAHDLLTDRPIGHVATVRRDGRLSVNPVALIFDGQQVRISTTKDRVKYRNLLADPRIAISVPHRNNPNLYIEIRGTARLEDDVDRKFVDQIAQRYMDKDHYDIDPPGAERVVVTIEAEQVSMPKIPLANAPPTAPDSVSAARHHGDRSD
jgi:PPOX class probable F420-dependent enzyme